MITTKSVGLIGVGVNTHIRNIQLTTPGTEVGTASYYVNLESGASSVK